MFPLMVWGCTPFHPLVRSCFRGPPPVGVNQEYPVPTSTTDCSPALHMVHLLAIPPFVLPRFATHPFILPCLHFTPSSGPIPSPCFRSSRPTVSWWHERLCWAVTARSGSVSDDQHSAAVAPAACIRIEDSHLLWLPQ